jgi:LPXTG-motif cell wall-anchored protein
MEGKNTMSHSFRSLLFMVLFAIVLAFSTTQRVSAHAEFKSAVPAPDTTIATAPAQVMIVFTEELEPQGNTITVKNAAGTQVDNGDTQLDKSDANRMTMIVSLKAGLPNGVYTVTWENNGADGHSESDSYSFTVGTASQAAPPTKLPQTGSSDFSPSLWLVLSVLFGIAGIMLRRLARP